MPFVLIRHENDASRSLYTKLGFEKVFDMARIKLYPFESVEMDKNADNKPTDEQANGNYKNGDTTHNGVNNHKL